jgi:hypothetical protein
MCLHGVNLNFLNFNIKKINFPVKWLPVPSGYWPPRRPLRIAATTTKTGLKVATAIDTRVYEKGIKITCARPTP